MAKYTLRIKQGATFKLSFWWRESLRNLDTNQLILDADGVAIPSSPFNLSGYTARMHLRKAVSSATPYLALTDSDGITVNAPTSVIKPWVRAASSANITALSATQTVDGVALAVGDRVLVKNQTDAATNGIYVVASGAWARASDADSFSELNNATVWVYQGTKNAESQWKQVETLTSLTDAQTWERDYLTGRVDIDITDEKTATLPTSGVYDLELVSSGGEVTRILEGKFRLSMEVTR